MVVLLIARVSMFDQLPNLRFKLLVIIPKYSQIAESTYTRVIPLMMQFLVLKCVLTYTRVYTVLLLECQITHLGIITHRLRITALEAKSEIALNTILPF